MTEQQVFDRVATHLLRQGCRATNSSGVCVLVNDNGCRCAVGSLLGNDPQYLNSEMGVDHPIVRRDLLNQGIDINCQFLVKQLQLLHDSKWAYEWTPGCWAMWGGHGVPNKLARPVTVGDWPEYLINIACRYNLNFSCVLRNI